MHGCMLLAVFVAIAALVGVATAVPCPDLMCDAILSSTKTYNVSMCTVDSLSIMATGTTLAINGSFNVYGNLTIANNVQLLVQMLSPDAVIWVKGNVLLTQYASIRVTIGHVFRLRVMGTLRMFAMSTICADGVGDVGHVNEADLRKCGASPTATAVNANTVLQTGGDGGTHYGIGGFGAGSDQVAVVYDQIPSNLTYGCSGGSSNAGPGGNGGGAIFIQAQTVCMPGARILARGLNGNTAGAGGGAGGAIAINCDTFTVFSAGATIDVSGGGGSTYTPLGGGGGGGVIVLNHTSVNSNLASLAIVTGGSASDGPASIGASGKFWEFQVPYTAPDFSGMLSCNTYPPPPPPASPPPAAPPPAVGSTTTPTASTSTSPPPAGTMTAGTASGTVTATAASTETSSGGPSTTSTNPSTSTATSPTSSSSTPSSSMTQDALSGSTTTAGSSAAVTSNSGGLAPAALYGIIGGGAALLLLVILVVVIVSRRRRAPTAQNGKDQATQKLNPGSEATVKRAPAPSVSTGMDSNLSNPVFQALDDAGDVAAESSARSERTQPIALMRSVSTSTASSSAVDSTPNASTAVNLVTVVNNNEDTQRTTIASMTASEENTQRSVLMSERTKPVSEDTRRNGVISEETRRGEPLTEDTRRGGLMTEDTTRTMPLNEDTRRTIPTKEDSRAPLSEDTIRSAAPANETTIRGMPSGVASEATIRGTVPTAPPPPAFAPPSEVTVRRSAASNSGASAPPPPPPPSFAPPDANDEPTVRSQLSTAPRGNEDTVRGGLAR